MGYLTISKIRLFSAERDRSMFMYDKFDSKGKEVVIACFKVLSWHCLDEMRKTIKLLNQES